MRKPEDTLTRARRALSQVDPELDLTRTRSDALVRTRSRPASEPEPDDASSAGVEILRHGERPTLPRRRSTVWALAASVALLGGAGIGTALLWPVPGGVLPGAPASLEPTPGPSLPTNTPSTGPSLGPRECASSPPTSRATPGPERPRQPSDSLPPDGCDVSPSPFPSTTADETDP
ncbi:hypothetical protein ACQEVI_20420 [Promicromonospora sp. CA-289599]|uniref:hypothetical protein n=1 Tax=Promicromonospora sp. CA-289599 TaxID=3240014 RepID=UPI003D90AEE2